MDLETENRIAAILMKEASDLRRQAENEGSLAYLREPTLRSKPNSRFLTATVLGVQQANRAVEVNELWRLREKQVELEDRLEGRRNRGRGSSGSYYKDVCESRSYSGRSKAEPSESDSRASKKRYIDDLRSSDDEGLRDEDMEEFLSARRKRGRGAVGSRVDETGPYLPHSPGSRNVDEVSRSSRAPLGPAKPSYLKSSESSDDESLKSDKKMAKAKSSKKHSKRHKSERKSKEDAKKKKRREEDKKKKKRKHRD